MKFSKKTEYAIRALIEMVMRMESGVTWMQISQIAQSTSIPEKFLEQILLSLRNGGLLKSRRGIDGGYTLNIPASQVQIGQVVKLLEGSGAGESSSKKGSDDDVYVVYSDLVQQAERVFNEVLNSCSLSDLAARVKNRRDFRARNSEYQI